MKKQNRIKVGVTSLLLAILLSGVYGLGVRNSNNSAQAQADMFISQALGSRIDDSALLVNAVQFYEHGKGVTAEGYQVYNLEIWGKSARGKTDSGDSGSAFYATKTNGRWNVVFAGQIALTSATASQYNIPTKWVGQTSW